MNKEMVNMTNEEMFLALMGRMDKVDGSLAKLDSKIDGVEIRLSARIDGVENRLENVENRLENVEDRLENVENRLDNVEDGLCKLSVRIDGVENNLGNLNDKIDKMESDINMEIQAVRVEMEVVNKSLKKDISFLNEKIDHIMILKDVDGIEKMKIRLDVLEQGYRMIKEKIG